MADLKRRNATEAVRHAFDFVKRTQDSEEEALAQQRIGSSSTSYAGAICYAEIFSETAIDSLRR